MEYSRILWLLLTLLDFSIAFNPDELLKSSVTKYGLTPELHKVTTEDGYILTIVRIPNRRKTPILIMHGLFGCSADFISQGPEKSLALLAYSAGFDVWMGNNRGTTFSKKHESLDLKSRAYWRFSFHELGLFDLSAMVDYILKTTNRKKLHYIAHSQGATQFFVLNSLRPEYNDLFISAHLSAPVTFIHHATSPSTILASRFDELEAAAKFTGMYELSGRGNSSYMDAAVAATRTGFIPPDLLLVNVWYFLGYHDSINRTMLVELLKYSPAGASIYQVLHFIQLFNSKNFQQYDFGPKENIQRYGIVRPPTYPLHKVTTPTYLYYSEYDNMNEPEDVDALAERLPNLQLKYKVPVRRWNHLDFLYGSSAYRLYQMILFQMAKA